jgi:hypothetical protein
MSRVTSEQTVRCACRQCGTSATVTHYDCGCVRVKIHNDRRACAECTDFSGMRYTAPDCR